MQVLSSFAVPVEREIAWQTLSDLPRIAPCMPGARIEGRVDGADKPTFDGHFAIKVGPVRASYAGQITMMEIDEAAGRIVLAGAGSDRDGAGSVSATITGVLREEAGQCVVELTTDLDVKGRLSQFTGRSSMVQGIANRVVGEFAANVGEEMLHPRTESVASTSDPIVSPASSGSGAATEFDALSFGLDAVRGVVNARSLAIALGAGLLGLFLKKCASRSIDVTLHVTLDGATLGGKMSSAIEVAR